MRWVIASLLLLGIAIFVSQKKGQKMSAEAPGPASSPSAQIIPEEQKPAAPETKTENKDTALTEELKESKPALEVKDTVREDVMKDPHGTSSALMKAGETVGRVAELEVAHPERKEEFLAYYKECYENSSVTTVTRVQCLKRYVRSADLNESEIAAILATLPRAVNMLYKRAAGLP